jgi:hypothetical protein
MQTQRNTNTTHANDSAIRDVLFSPRGVKRQRRETLAHAATTTTTTQTQTDPEAIIEEKEQEREDTCAICMDVTSSTKNVSVTECGHRFCTSCLLKSLQIKNTCPMCRAEIEPARKPNLEQLTATVAADLVQAEEREIDIHRRIALIGAFGDPRGRSGMILSLCREIAFGVAHSIAGWQGTDDQTYHSSWADYEYTNDDDNDSDSDSDSDSDGDGDNDNDGDSYSDSDSDSDSGNEHNEYSDSEESEDGSDNRCNDAKDDNAHGDRENDENSSPPSWDAVFPPNEVFPATTQSHASQSLNQTTTATATTTTTTTTAMSQSQPGSTRVHIHNLISGVVSYMLFYTFYYALPNLVSSLIQNIHQERQE